MRPTFEIALPAGDTAVLDRLRDRLARDDVDLMGQVVEGHAMLKLPRARRSMLSPVLNLELAEREDGTPLLRGRFSPQPNVWTGFMAIYGVLAMIGLGGLMYGFAKMTVDESPAAMLLLPICLALIGFVYGAAFIGQGLTADDMYEMRAFVEEIAVRRIH
jgi:ABC-type Na+ efflux pump permease subunit